MNRLTKLMTKRIPAFQSLQNSREKTIICETKKEKNKRLEEENLAEIAEASKWLRDNKKNI